MSDIEDVRVFKIEDCLNEFVERRVGTNHTNIHKITRETAPNSDFDQTYYNYIIAGLALAGDATVTFVKADGSLREMNISRDKLHEYMSANPPAPQYSQAAETRKKNHPNLLAVFDTDSDSVKSINLKTLKEVRHGDFVIEFTESSEIE